MDSKEDRASVGRIERRLNGELEGYDVSQVDRALVGSINSSGFCRLYPGYALGFRISGLGFCRGTPLIRNRHPP